MYYVYITFSAKIVCPFYVHGDEIQIDLVETVQK